VKISPVQPKDLDKFLLSVGCTFKRQKGSHKVYWRADLNRPIIVPQHDPVPVFIIKVIMRQLNISPEQYNRILHGA
jgi:predicted RNA binding protein YcfA (HicA-like mRNA interferase family)